MNEPNLENIKERVNKQNPEHSFWYNNCLLLAQSGSHLYGTNREDSDLDIRGISVSTRPYWFGTRTCEHLESQDGDDFFLWEIRKFLREIMRVSPNTVEILFVPKEKIYFSDPYWFEILPKIKKLVNQTAYMAYKGYSTAQLKKMVVKHSNKTGRRDIVNEFGFDLKFVAHGFRLARQGRELLETGNITFPRPDAKFLKAIRNGEIFRGEDGIDECIEEWKEEIALLDKGLQNTILPKKADFNEYEQLVNQIFEEKVYGTN